MVTDSEIKSFVKEMSHGKSIEITIGVWEDCIYGSLEEQKNEVILRVSLKTGSQRF